MSKNKVEPSEDAQHTAVRELCEREVLAYRNEMSGSSSFQLVRLDAYACAFKGDATGVFSNHLNFIGRNYRLVEVDGKCYLLPERKTLTFVDAVKKALPHASVVLKEYVSLG